jgi:hypothetical protein
MVCVCTSTGRARVVARPARACGIRCPRARHGEQPAASATKDGSCKSVHPLRHIVEQVIGVQGRSFHTGSNGRWRSREIKGCSARRPANTGKITRPSKAKPSGLGTCCSPRGSSEVLVWQDGLRPWRFGAEQADSMSWFTSRSTWYSSSAAPSGLQGGSPAWNFTASRRSTWKESAGGFPPASRPDAATLALVTKKGSDLVDHGLSVQGRENESVHEAHGFIHKSSNRLRVCNGGASEQAATITRVSERRGSLHSMMAGNTCKQGRE